MLVRDLEQGTITYWMRCAPIIVIFASFVKQDLRTQSESTLDFAVPLKRPTNVKKTLFIGLRALTTRANTEPMRASEIFLIRGGNVSVHLKKNLVMQSFDLASP